MNSYIVKQTVSFFFQPTATIGGIKTLLPFTDYAVGDAIDGSHGSLKAQVSIYTSDVTPTFAETVDGITCDAVTMFGYNTDVTVTDECNSAVLTLEKGFEAGTYSFEIWYDSSSISTGQRIGEQGTFTVTAGQTPNATPPYTP